MKRKVLRRLQHRRRRRVVYSRDAVVLGRGIGWWKRRSNPYYAWAKGEQQRRQRQALVASMFLFFITIGLLLWHPFFHIQRISVTGSKRWQPSVIAAAVQQLLRKSRWHLFPGSSYFFLDEQRLGQELRRQFALSAVSLQKHFPQGLSIDVKEKMTAIIYDTGYEYSYVGIDGSVIEELRALTDDERQIESEHSSSTVAITVKHTPSVARLQQEFGAYPIVYDSRPALARGTAGEPLTRDTVGSILIWTEKLHSLAAVHAGYIEIASSSGDAIIHTDTGMEIRVRLAEHIDEQFGRLVFAIKEKGGEARWQYVDVRYPGRAYWQ